MEPVRPAYGARSLERIIPAILGGPDAGHDTSWLPESVRSASIVVLLVLDGLGWTVLDARRAELPTLAGMEGGPIGTVVPSTTACALTSLTTGLTPAEHGIVGYRMRVDDDILNVLRWQTGARRKPPDPFTVQRHSAFLGRAVPVVTRTEFRSTGFTDAHLRGCEFHGWSTVSMLVEQCRVLVREGGPFVYLYYPGVDTVAHEYGVAHPFFAAELRFVDELTARLLEVLPKEAALVLTADHGQVEVGDRWRSLAPLDSMTRMCAGEGRFRYLYAERGAAGELADAARDLFGDEAWVLTREELLEEGWLGPRAPSSSVRRRIGDVVLAARGPVAFVDPALPHESRLVAAHGSLTAEEMLVPLVGTRGVGSAGRG
jgi:hypothetical protein